MEDGTEEVGGYVFVGSIAPDVSKPPAHEGP
jgi:hypothetical protein